MIEHIVKIAQDVNNESRLWKIVDEYGDALGATADTLRNNANLLSEFANSPLGTYRETDDKRWLLEAATKASKGGFAEKLLKLFGGAELGWAQPTPRYPSLAQQDNQLRNPALWTRQSNRVPLPGLYW